MNTTRRRNQTAATPVSLESPPSPAPANERDTYLSLKELAAYSGLSVRTLRNHLSRAVRPLPCYRVGGKVLVRRSEFDRWMSSFRCVAVDRVDTIVADVVKEL